MPVSTCWYSQDEYTLVLLSQDRTFAKLSDQPQQRLQFHCISAAMHSDVSIHTF